MKKMPLAAARRLFDGLVIAMLVCAVLFTLSNNFFLGCAVILLGLAATAFHFAVLRCPHCGKHLGRERGNTCPHCGPGPPPTPPRGGFRGAPPAGGAAPRAGRPTHPCHPAGFQKRQNTGETHRPLRCCIHLPAQPSAVFSVSAVGAAALAAASFAAMRLSQNSFTRA